MNRCYSCEGVVIKRKNIGEADKLLTIFTREYGKKVVIAKGIRRLFSRRAPHLELFSHVRLLLNRGKTFDYVSEVVNIQPFLTLRTRLERISYGYIVLELTERLTAENQEAPLIFDRLINYISVLNDHETQRSEAALALSTFKVFILEELGFIHRLDTATKEWIDSQIEEILNAPLKSPLLLTTIQSGL